MKSIAVKIIFAGMIAVSAVSCLDSSYTASYPLGVTFEVGDEMEFTKDSIYYEKMLLVGNNIYFQNLYDSSTGEFGGCILSRAHNLHTDDCTPYSVYDTSAYAGSETFMLFYDNPETMPEHHIYFAVAASGSCTPTGCFIQNTTETVGSVRETYGDGDWLLLTATGYLDGKETGKAEIYLADFRDSKDSVVTSWTPFALNKLGNIEYIDFELTSSKTEVPQYFCLDNFYANITLTSGN